MRRGEVGRSTPGSGESRRPIGPGGRGRRHLLLVVAALLAGSGSGSDTAFAATCPVPTATHPTIGAAVRDASCTTVTLGAAVYPENVAIGRDLVLSGAGAASTTIAGAIVLTGVSTELTLGALTVDGTGPGVAGCWNRLLDARDGGAVLAGADVEVRHSATGGMACRLFADDFESGGVLAWSNAVP
ncbi:MAG: hypothetical protein ABI689_08860 [Thermoanaerobaculia bacterium]